MTIGSKSDLTGMRAVGKLVGRAIQEMQAAVRPGLTTEQLDDVGAAFLRRHGARSAPQLTYHFPGFNCISVNDEVVHGVPGPRVLQPSDVVKIDVTAELDGFIADAAVTVVIPPVTPRAHNLTQCTRSAFKRAIKTAVARTKVAELGRAVETEVDVLLGNSRQFRRDFPALASLVDVDFRVQHEAGSSAALAGVAHAA